MTTEIDARLAPALQAGLAELSLPAALSAPLLKYVALLLKWNKAYNLTAVRSAEEMVPVHLLDSLSINPYLYNDRVLDVGTGPGLPGIPLALANPDRHFTLLDSIGKKTRFIQQVITELELTNVTVVQSRIEEHRPEQPYSCIVSRAFSALSEMVNGCLHCLSADGIMLAMKGQYPAAELQALPAEVRLDSVIELQVPGLSAARHLVIIRRA